MVLVLQPITHGVEMNFAPVRDWKGTKMERRFIEGQTVDLSIPGSEGASAHTTSVLDVSEEEIILRRPPTLNGGDQGGVVVEFLPEGDQAPPERGEIESVSDPRILKLRRLELSESGAQRRELLRQADEFPIEFRFISFSEHSSRKIHFELNAPASSTSRVALPHDPPKR